MYLVLYIQFKAMSYNYWTVYTFLYVRLCLTSVMIYFSNLVLYTNNNANIFICTTDELYSYFYDK